MELTVLGSGSTIAHPRRTSAGFWVESAGAHILLDISATVPHRIAAEGLALAELDSIWISHFHMDHCGGLGPFFAGTKHTPAMKMRKKKMTVYGPPGTRELVERFSAVHRYRLLEQPFPVEVIEVGELNEFEIAPGVEAVAMSTPHTAESHALHLRDAEGKRLVYSSDTSFAETLASLANGVDLFILESAFVRNKPAKKHLELAEAVYLINKARPRRAMLTHFYPEWDDVEFSQEVARLKPYCDVVEAQDGLRLVV